MAAPARTKSDAQAGLGRLSVPSTVNLGGDRVIASMTARHDPWYPPNEVPTRIIKCLEQVMRYARDRPLVVFEQWLDALLATFHARPLAAAYIAKHHQTPPIETQHWIDAQRSECAEAIARIKRSYGKHAEQVFQHFWEAAEILNTVADNQIVGDWLGGVYHEWELANKHAQQYFTPWHMAYLCTTLTIGDWQKVIAATMYKAVAAANLISPAYPWGTIIVENAHERIETLRYLFRKFPDQVLPHLQPARYYEPALGSGVMHLAAAFQIGP